MREVFGTVDGVGVFIRSDTNVEDLPGFTGAGLNLTLPNVVGLENIINGLKEVWASPYTRRAFAWRNAHMDGPEHVYPAVLLLKTVPSDVSGVMITADVDTGDREFLSVAVNEGVGGAVEGQAAESLRIDRRSGAILLLAVASAPTRHVPNPRGGIDELPASGRETLLGPAEIRSWSTSPARSRASSRPSRTSRVGPRRPTSSLRLRTEGCSCCRSDRSSRAARRAAAATCRRWTARCGSARPPR